MPDADHLRQLYYPPIESHVRLPSPRETALLRHSDEVTQMLGFPEACP
jgi:hypothetical protein